MSLFTSSPVVTGGFKDRFNHYAHSASYFRGHLIIGTSRANLQFLRLGKIEIDIPYWPVECTHNNYSEYFEEHVAGAEIWSVNLDDDSSHSHPRRIYKSPFLDRVDGSTPFRSDISYRSMCIYNNALYVATTSRSRGFGPDILRTLDGQTFERLPKPIVQQSSENTATPILLSIRNLIAFDDLLITCASGSSDGNINFSHNSCIYATTSPDAGDWHVINGNGFGSFPDCLTVFCVCVHEGELFAATAGLYGFEVFRGVRNGKYTFEWTKILSNGAGRGALNQGVVSMCSFNGSLFLGTGIQNGGFDRKNNIGPAAFELLKIDREGNFTIIVGESRNSTVPTSGLGPGFGNPFNAYLWSLTHHNGYLFAGTLDTSIFALYTSNQKLRQLYADLASIDDIESWLLHRGGADLWVSSDGFFWEPVTRNGFNNYYNYGIRTLISAGTSLYAGTANPFGPRTWNQHRQCYSENLRGGLEIHRVAKELRNHYRS